MGGIIIGRKLTVGILVILFVFGQSLVHSFSGEVQEHSFKDYIFFDDVKITTDVPLFEIDNIIMAPIRAIALGMEFETTWDGNKSEIRFVLGSDILSMFINSNECYFNGKKLTAPVSCTIRNERIYCPIMFVVEQFGADTKVDYTSGEIYVNISTQDKPIELWVSDLDINGISDNAINMIDIITLAKYFNSTTDQNGFKDDYDFNCDGAININDIMLVAKHFNSSTDDYPKY